MSGPIRIDEDVLAEAIRQAPVGLQIVGPDGVIAYVNERLAVLLSSTPEQVVGTHVSRWFAEHEAITAHAVAGDPDSIPIELATPAPRTVLVSANAQRDGLGAVTYVRWFVRDVSAQKFAERELRRSLEATAARLDAVLQQMPSAVAVVEAPSGKVLLANPQNERVFRQPTAPMKEVGEYARFRGLHPDGREVAPEEWPLSRSIATGEVVRGEEIHIVRGDGSHGHIRCHSAPVRDGDGTIVAGVVIYDDVSEQKEAEASLREQLRINDLLVRVGGTLNAELDLDPLMQKLTDEATALCRAQFGSFFYNVVDESGERYTLYTLSGVPREAFSRFPMPRKTAIFGPTFDGEGIVLSEDITKDARYGKNPPYRGMPEGHLPVRSYLAVSVKSRSGEVLGALFFGHESPGVFTPSDASAVAAVGGAAAAAIDNARLYRAARTAEARARSERAKLESIVEHAPAYISVLRGPDHVFEFTNPSSRALLGADVIGRPAREVLTEGNRETLLALYDRAYRTGEPTVMPELAAVRDWSGDGHPRARYFMLVIEPHRDGEGIQGVVTFSYEVTAFVEARRRAEAAAQELEAANRAKDEFLATVSHELRTPLNAILGWTRMLRGGALPADRQARALETIERNANAQTQLIEDLLDVSRIISGKLRLDVGMVDVGNVVASAIEAVRPAAVARGVSLHATTDPDAGPILGDGDRLQQVVWNLLSNAVKFTGKGGKVQVAVRRRDSSVELIVHDTGQGIPIEFLPHVFERFRQADNATTRAHGGLGLGLAIVRHLVELHGGTVRADSEGPGKGSTFTVLLPISPLRSTGVDRPPPIHLAREPQEIVCPPELAGAHILVVDDEADARELLTSVLLPCRARVTTASSAAEALRAVEEGRPDLIVSDIGMPGEDGYSLIGKIRALPPAHGGRTPAVALTAYARMEDRTKALIAGFNMHVPKPVEPAELLVVLASLATMFPRSAR